MRARLFTYAKSYSGGERGGLQSLLTHHNIWELLYTLSLYISFLLPSLTTGGYDKSCTQSGEYTLLYFKTTQNNNFYMVVQTGNWEDCVSKYGGQKLGIEMDTTWKYF